VSARAAAAEAVGWWAAVFDAFVFDACGREFVFTIIFLTSGLSYAIAVWGMSHIG